MSGKKNPLAKKADACRQLLRERSISADGPGTILRDVERVIAFIGERGLVTGSKQGNLPPAVLPELNAQLASPVEVPAQRLMLRDFPNLAGIYVLLRVMNLVRVEGKRLTIDAEALTAWRRFNATEKYFSLLEAWLYHAEAGVLGGERRRGEDLQFGDTLRFLAELPTSKWKGFDADSHLYIFSGRGIAPWNAQLMARFGLIQVKPRPLAERRGGGGSWTMKAARRTAWGTAVAWAILEASLTEERGELWLLKEEDADFGTLQPAFRPYFPEWEKTWAAPLAQAAGAEKGSHIFKASFADYRVQDAVWCRLAVPATASLDELAYAVLAAFQFSDTEHLYEFRYRDRLGKSRACFHPMTEGEEFYAHEIAVGETGLPEKGVMKFMFDYGDSWRFEFRLERIGPPGDEKAPIKVIESGGQAPKQYPDWE